MFRISSILPLGADAHGNMCAGREVRLGPRLRGLALTAAAFNREFATLRARDSLPDSGLFIPSQPDALVTMQAEKMRGDGPPRGLARTAQIFQEQVDEAMRLMRS